jgi:hypothetical protein
LGEVESETFLLESEGRTLVSRDEKALFRLMVATYRRGRRVVGVLHECSDL